MVDDPVVEVSNLRKRYERVAALSGLTFCVRQGSIHAFLGRNGAGKTTTLKVLLGLVRPDGGEARVFGLPADVEAASLGIRRRCGFVSEDKDLPDRATIDQTIRWMAAFSPRWRPDRERDYLAAFGLDRSARIGRLSRGMRTKLAWLLALCRGADLLILDEPTSGLDPAAAEEVLQILVSHVARERLTVLMSTHQISDVEQVADHVTLVHRGRAVLTDELDRIKETFRRVHMVFDREPPQAVFTTAGVVRIHRAGRTLSVLTREGTERIVNEARFLQPVSMDIGPATLKEIFLETLAAHD